MAVTKIRGNTQILAGTITNAEISASAAIATSKLADGANFLKNDGSVVLSGDLNANSAYTVKNLKAPVADNDAARKVDVVSATQGLDVKESCRVATTAEITIATALNVGDTIDGVTLADGDRVLVKNQTTNPEDNGIYVAGAVPARAADCDEDAEVTAGLFTFVEEGTANADKGFVVTSNDPIVVGTNDIIFTQFSGSGTGDVNSASNVGSSGTGLFKQLNGSDLEFYKLNSVDNKLTVALDGTDKVDLTVNQGNIDHDQLANYAVAQHRIINDSGTSATELWSASKISSELGSIVSGVSSFNTRTGAVVPAANDYTWAQIDKTTSDLADLTTKSHTSLTDKGTNTHAQIDTHIADATKHRVINDSGTSATELWSASKINTELGTKEDSITTLPISKGGTNSSTALNNNRVVVSSGGAIVEAAAITASRALVSNASGIPIASAVTDTELGYVSGVTSAIQTQLDAKTVLADFVTREVPSGDIDGVNDEYALANTPSAGTEHVYLNGLLQDEGASDDYTISGGTITFNAAPLAGDKIHVSYLK